MFWTDGNNRSSLAIIPNRSANGFSLPGRNANGQRDLCCEISRDDGIPVARNPVVECIVVAIGNKNADIAASGILHQVGSLNRTLCSRSVGPNQTAGTEQRSAEIAGDCAGNIEETSMA